MKHANDIISHLFSQPSSHSKFQFHRCMEKVFSLLPPHMSRAISFSYLKDETLVIVVSNNAMTTEFHYKHNLIKELLKEVAQVIPCPTLASIRTIKVRYMHQQKPLLPPVVPPSYKECALGTFTNFATEEALSQKIETIRHLIEKNRKGS